MKRIIKEILIIAVASGIILGLAILGLNNFEAKAKQCDEAYGYTCSYYQVRNFEN